MLMLPLALACVVVLLYTYLGYPLLIALLARLRPLRVAPDPQWRPKVSACIAVYNGGKFLEAKLQSLLEQDWPRDKLEVLVYSDGSTDDSEAIVERWAASNPNVRLLRGPGRSGKPTGLNQMAAAASGEVLFITDVRQPLNREAVAELVQQLADPRVGCVSGNLVLKGSAGSGAYWRYEKFIRMQEARFRSIVGMSGSIAVLRKSDFAPLPADLILDDVWIPMRLRLQGRLILFAERAQAFDEAFDDDREFGRKVRTLAGNYQVFALLPGLLSPGNPSFLETISHKVLRLVCPFLLLALPLAGGAAWLEAHDLGQRRLAELLLGGQAVFYGLAALGRGAGKLGSLARTFVVLNAAALVGGWRYITGGQRVTW